MEEISLPRTWGGPLIFRGELVLGYDFGQRRKGQAWRMGVELYRTDDGRFVFHQIERTPSQGRPAESMAWFQSAEQHALDVKELECRQHCPAFMVSPVRMGKP